MTQKILTSLLVLAGASLALTPSSVASGATVTNVFESPTGNLVCKWEPSMANLTCGRWNDQRMVAMTTTGRAHAANHLSWAGETPRILAYGRQWVSPGRSITCGSYFNGIRCTNSSGHGLFISREYLNNW